MKYFIALALLVFSFSAIAEDPKNCKPLCIDPYVITGCVWSTTGTNMHFNGGEYVCDERILQPVVPYTAPVVVPDCSPETVPGSICTWPTTALVVLQQYNVSDGKGWQWGGKKVAVIDGTPLIPVSPTAVRQFIHLTYDDCWHDPAMANTNTTCFTFDRYFDFWN